MDFTREPIIETVITPREGCKLVIRSSKSTGQEEYFVDAVEVVSFGNSFFFRSLERPKAFLVPVSDYEILEVRETRMVLKNVGLDRAIKIAGGREGPMRGGREQVQEKPEPAMAEEGAAEETESPQPSEPKGEVRLDKKRDRRRHYRRRRGREESAGREGAPLEIGEERSDAVYKEGEAGKIELPEPKEMVEGEPVGTVPPLASTASFLTSLLPPPPNLISETIARYKDNALFRQAFYLKEQEETNGKSDEAIEGEPKIPLEQPAYGSFEISEEEEEEIYKQRKKNDSHKEDQEKEEGNKEKEEFMDQPPLESKDEVSNNNLHP